MARKLAIAGTAWVVLSFANPCAGVEFSWEEPNANVLPNGDLEWAPRPFVFAQSDSARYIDFAHGRDTNDGATRETPWQHHPWDPAATARSAACSGSHTYVFKRGVMYRGRLVADESGRDGDPIRLTSDPSWGQGEAAIVGSERVTGWTMGTDHPDIPDGSRVSYVDLDYAPRNVWLVEADGQTVRIPLARTPNWTVSDPNDIKSEWWEFDNPTDPWGSRTKLNGTESHLAVDTKHLNGPPDYYENALIWPEYGWVMSTPYPTRVLQYDPAAHSLVFGGQWSNAAGSYHVPRHARYYLEDKPHYLDAAGEFWFDKRGRGGRLYLRLPGDRDPNKAYVEVAKRITLIDSESMSHVHISGLSFRFTNVFWNLDAPPTRHKDVDPACIRLLGSGTDLGVVNCVFEHVHLPVRMKAVGDEAVIDRVVISDNVIRYTDHGAVSLADGGAWGSAYPRGRLYDVKVLRNKLFQIGRRPTRFGHGHAIEIDCAQTAEVAGNMGHQLYGSGIFVFGGKRSAAKVDRPLTRILIHHNKIVDSLLNSNDWGGIETWQGGPAYVFNNLSRNPRGYKNWGYKLQPDKPATSSFGHAYYMDGGFKQYYFNNIAWGNSNDPYGPLGNCSAFQEIHGFLASIFNNTVYNFVIGSRRQAPEAGRNKYLGNIWQSLGNMVFRHARPSNMMADPNAADAGEVRSEFHHESNAYAANIFYDVPEKFGVFEPDGRWYATADSFRHALARRHSLGDLGRLVTTSPLESPERGDFRPTASAAGKGVKVFVPWGLYATVAEWPFYPAGDDPTRIMDEHFHLARYYVNREDYKLQPMYPLHAVNVSAKDYVSGPLEDWTRGALLLNGRDQYAVLEATRLQPAITVPAFQVTNKSYGWIKFDLPKKVTPGKPFEARVTLQGKGFAPGLKLRADLHWSRRDGRFGGMNSFGGAAQEISGQGPYVFRFRPQSKPGLRNFIMTVWLTPTGEWSDRTETAQYLIAAATPSGGTSTYKSPQVDKSSFLVELYFKTSSDRSGDVLLEKMKEAGYSLTISGNGGVMFRVQGSSAAASVTSRRVVNDGLWHHVIAESDRASRRLVLYIDGRQDASATGVGTEASLSNTADLYVGGTPDGRCLSGTLEFARIALGTLQDAKTSIEELYRWQFDGPFLRDWTGQKPARQRRAAGAIDTP